MMYQPTNNRIVVVVMKASKLKKMDFIGSCGEKKYNNYDPRWSSFSLNQKKTFRSFTQLIMEDCVRKKSSESIAFLSSFC